MSITPLLVDSALKATLLLVSAGALAFTLRGSSAAIRHLIWSLAVIGSLALPVLGAVVPGWRAPLLAGIWPQAPAQPVETATASGRSASLDGVGKALDRHGSELDARGESLDRLGDRLDAGERDESALDAIDGLSTGALPAPAAMRGAASSAPDPGSRAERGGAGSLFESLALVWTLGAALVLLVLLVERLRVWGLASRSHRVGDPRLRRRCGALSRRLGLRRAPRLLEAGGAAMPMTWGLWRPALLLPAGAGDWSDERLDAVLLHELAHVRRSDYAIQLAAGLACALYWFNPLAWMAARRLRVEREHACDDEVLRAGSAPSSYAEELLEMARSLRCHRSTELAAMTMARPSQLTGRLLAVLDDGRSRRTVSRRLAVSGAVLLLALLVPLAALRPDVGEAAPAEEAARPEAAVATAAPGILQAPSCWDPRAPHRSRVHRSEPDGSVSLEWSSEECRVEVEVRGSLEFADDFTRIAGLSSDGFLRIYERADGAARELEVRPGADGPQFAWRVDGDRRDFGPEGRSWLAARLVPLIRRAGLAVEERVAWILEREGVEGVFEEVRIVSGDRAESEYLLQLIDQAALEDNQLEDALSLAAEEIGSDSRMAGFLVELAGRRGTGSLRLEAFWSAASTVGSDSDHSRMLLRLLEVVPASEGALERVLRSASRNIGSDSEMTRFLTRLARAYPEAPTGGSADPFWAAAATVGSDSGHRTLLLELIEDREGSTPPRLALSSAARNIGSDSDMVRFLTAFGERYPDLIAGELRTDFLAAASTVGSDSEHGNMLLRLTRGEPSPWVLELALTSAADNIGSDSSMRRFLVTLAERHPGLMRGDLRQAYLAAASTVGSDSERRHVMSALEEGPR